jgi:putative nucleotidyltransferase with HDIG domain
MDGGRAPGENARLMEHTLPRVLPSYSRALFALGLTVAAVLAVVSAPAAGPALWIVLGASVVVALPGIAFDGERSVLSLAHLPILAAVFLLSPAVAALVAGGLAFSDTRRYGSIMWMANSGAAALAAAAAAGVFREVAPLVGLPTDPSDPLWFFAATAGAATWVVTNHAFTALTISIKYGDRPLRVWVADLRPTLGGDLIGATILIGFVGLMAGVHGVGLRIVAATVALLCIGLLVMLILRTREREQALADREQALAARETAMRAAEQAAAQARAASTLAAKAQARAAEAAAGLQEASDRVQNAVSRLHDVATGTVPVLVTMIDLKDRYTARHSAVVAHYARMLAEELRWRPEEQALAHMAGLVHDIGKVGLPDELLRKPSPPTEPEAHLIRCHPDWGADALAGMALFPMVVDGVRSHHERWDGSGYPGSLAGAEIPVLGRMLAVTDSYEAMIAQRPFREPMDAASARAELAREAGRLYDPRMVEAFLVVLDRLGDEEGALRRIDFAAEWRRACDGLDLERLYLPELARPR